MAQTEDPKVIIAAEIGRKGLYKALFRVAGMNMMEKEYRHVLIDLKQKAALEGMAAEVKDLPETEKMAEVLARLLTVLVMQTNRISRGGSSGSCTSTCGPPGCASR